MSAPGYEHNIYYLPILSFQKHHKRNHHQSSNPKCNNVDSLSNHFDGSDVEEEEALVDKVCYDIAISPIFGRYLVAKRNIRPGEAIIFEDPVVIGPSSDTDCSCLGCYIPLSPTEDTFK